MSIFDDKFDNFSDDYDSPYTQNAQTHIDYYGRLPEGDDAADHIRIIRSYTVVS